MIAQFDGGPAFPRIQHVCLNEQTDAWGEVATTPGMTLRDWFAGMALTGVCANPTVVSQGMRATGDTAEQFAADSAYEIADAMLAARERKESA